MAKNIKTFNTGCDTVNVVLHVKSKSESKFVFLQFLHDEIDSKRNEKTGMRLNAKKKKKKWEKFWAKKRMEES